MSFLIAGIALVLLIYILIHYLHTKKKPKDHIPSLDDISGPTGIPFLGNIGDFFTSYVQLWINTRQRGLKYYPIYKIKFFGQHMVSLLDPRDVEMILTDTTCIKGEVYDTLREFTGNGLIASEGELWRQRRKKITKSFHFSFLSNYISIFNKETDSFIKKLRSDINKPIDILSKIAPLALKVVSESIVGERSKMDELEIKNYIKSIRTMTEVEMLKSATPHINFFYEYTEMRRKETEAIKTIRKFSNNVYEESLNVPMDNEENSLRLMNILMKNPELFNVSDIKNEIDTFIFAGHDTTSSALSFALMVLANHSKYQDEIRQEMVEVGVENGMPSFSQLKNMNFLDRFLKECLRLFPPAHFIARTLTKDTITKTGYLLPAGTIIMIHIFDIHRNPNLFPDPDKFDTDRFLVDNIKMRHPFSYIPFSAGHRNCVAQRFAKLEVKSVICGILDKFSLQLVTEIDKVVFLWNSILKPKDDIRVKFIPR